MQWTQTYPGRPSMLPSCRSFVAAMLADAAAPRLVRRRAAAVTAEYVTTCISGGEPAVRVTVTTRTGWARIDVGDIGPWRGDDVDTYARGLGRAADLADRFGHDVAGDRSDLWAEFGWPR